MFSWGFDLLLHGSEGEAPSSDASNLLSLVGSVCVVAGVLAAGRAVEEKLGIRPRRGRQQQQQQEQRRRRLREAGGQGRRGHSVAMLSGLLWSRSGAGASGHRDAGEGVSGTQVECDGLGVTASRQEPGQQQRHQQQQQQQHPGNFANAAQGVGGAGQTEPLGATGMVVVIVAEGPAAAAASATAGLNVPGSDVRPDPALDLDRIQILDPGSFKQRAPVPTPAPVPARNGTPATHTLSRRLSNSSSMPNFAQVPLPPRLGSSLPKAAAAALPMSRWGRRPAAASSSDLAATATAAAAAAAVGSIGRPYGRRAGVCGSSVPGSIVPRGDMDSESVSSGGNSEDSSSGVSSGSSSAHRPLAASLVSQGTSG
ncbi:MAG: hypothetical protein WDW36_007562 [Sanguina aurantia]